MYNINVVSDVIFLGFSVLETKQMIKIWF